MKCFAGGELKNERRWGDKGLRYKKEHEWITGNERESAGISLERSYSLCALLNWLKAVLCFLGLSSRKLEFNLESSLQAWLIFESCRLRMHRCLASRGLNSIPLMWAEKGKGWRWRLFSQSFFFLSLCFRHINLYNERNILWMRQNKMKCSNKQTGWCREVHFIKGLFVIFYIFSTTMLMENTMQDDCSWKMFWIGLLLEEWNVLFMRSRLYY